VPDRLSATSDPTIIAAIHAVATVDDIDHAMSDLLELVMRASDATAAGAFLWDGAAGALAAAGSVGLSDAQLAAYAEGARDRAHPIAVAAHDRVPVLGAADDVAKDLAISTWPIVLTSGGIEEPVGAIALMRSAPWTMDDADAERVTAMADLIGLLVERARLAEVAGERADWQERLANSDGLTGLANARTMSRVIDLEIARAARQGSDLFVAIFDVDGLTAINAEVGRAAGDEILREVAAVVAESVRLVDTVARRGADEFVLAAPGAKGTTVVARIVEAVAARPAIAGRKFTVSAGLARFPIDGTTEAELVDAATAALNAARATGPGTLAEAARA
jgi:diguanylate cyclase (GGDEF)-like protein